MSMPDAGLPRAMADSAFATQTPSNVRAVLRVGADFFLRVIDTLARLAGDDLILALVYNAMWTANVRRITHSTANAEYGGMDQIPPDDLRDPASVLALANSLRIPYETVRRCVQRMVGQGLCLRIGRKGYIVPAAVFARQNQRAAVEEGLPNLLRVLSELKRAGFDFKPFRHALPNTVALTAPGEVPANVRALLRVVLELILRGIDTLGRQRGDNFLEGLIYTAIWTANVRHITGSSEDNRKFGDLRELPSDEMRRPISVHALAASLRIPYETVRRTTNNLVRGGVALRVEGKGLIIPRQQLARTDVYDGVRQSYIDIARWVADLHRAGFDFRNY